MLEEFLSITSTGVSTFNPGILAQVIPPSKLFAKIVSPAANTLLWFIGSTRISNVLLFVPYVPIPVCAHEFPLSIDLKIPQFVFCSPAPAYKIVSFVGSTVINRIRLSLKPDCVQLFPPSDDLKIP